jgi:parvulin-like peptidyl-prolyl isomerase
MFRYEYFVSSDLEGVRFKSQLNEEIKRLVSCEILAREGRKQYLQNSEAVQRDLRPWTDFWAARALFYQMRDSVSVSDDDVLQHLIQYKKIFGPKYEVNVREILCPSPENMSQAMDELQRGSPFSDVAQQFSIRSDWAKNGGESGYFLVSQHPDIGFHALYADTGKLIGPLHLTDGYSIFKIIGKRRTKGASTDFDTLRQNIKTKLLIEKRKQTIDRFIANLARRQQVTINYSALKNVKITAIPMFTRRRIGFGGTMSAEPMLLQQWDWIKEFQKPINILP